MQFTGLRRRIAALTAFIALTVVSNAGANAQAWYLETMAQYRASTTVWLNDRPYASGQAQDGLQNLVVDLVRKGQFTEQQPPYLERDVRNAIVSNYRKLQPALYKTDPIAYDGLTAMNFDTVDHLVAKQKVSEVLAADPNGALARTGLGYKPAEIAIQDGISANAAAQRVARARRALAVAEGVAPRAEMIGTTESLLARSVVTGAEAMAKQAEMARATGIADGVITAATTNSERELAGDVALGAVSGGMLLGLASLRKPRKSTKARY